MLSLKENFLETIKKDGKPDRLVCDFEMTKLLLGDPWMQISRAGLKRGESGVDKWGSFFMWTEDAPSAVPHPTPDNLVIKDILEWRDVLHVPPLENNPDDWQEIRDQKANIDVNEYVPTGFVAPGLFERLHRLMGFEGCFIAMLEEPEEFQELVDVIATDRMKNLKILVENEKPEMILSHDDWGSKQSLFISPDHWREFIKPHYMEFYGYLKSEGIITMHHADSFLEPIVEDMIEVGIDIWQGALPENDIVKLQEQIDGRMTIMGGIDASIIDRVDSTEEEIRAEVRRACATYGPGGHFIPSITYGGPNYLLFPHVEEIMFDEIRKYNNETYGK